MLTHITHPKQTLTRGQLGLISHHTVLTPRCAALPQGTWAPGSHTSCSTKPGRDLRHTTIHSDAHSIHISGDVPPKSSISCLCELCFTNSERMWGYQSTWHTSWGGVVLRLLTFISWRANASFSNTKKAGKDERTSLAIIFLAHQSFCPAPDKTLQLPACLRSQDPQDTELLL